MSIRDIVIGTTYPGVVDESLAAVELGARLAIDNENIRAFHRRTESSSSRDHIVGILIRQDLVIETSKEAQFTNIRLSSCVRRHPNSWIATPDHHVMCQGRSGACDFDILRADRLKLDGG